MPLPASFSFEQGAMVEPAAVGVHTVSRAGSMAGLNVAVLGAGPIGNLVGQVARAAGAKVLVTDVSEYRLEVARQCGLRSVSLAGRESLEGRLGPRLRRQGVPEGLRVRRGGGGRQRGHRRHPERRHRSWRSASTATGPASTWASSRTAS
ncbi:MAG: hypothetical protein M0C28_40085 [Candidatus Moduliflexus flocculans]|nr:hypothetical protein [Candidatus Moduliflexus flocculans]